VDSETIITRICYTTSEQHLGSR